MTVVAFSDPNDLLTYRIVPEHLAEDFREFRVINVLVSNDTTYFGYLERPDTAHCGYPWNPHVFGMLARGLSGRKTTAFGLDVGRDLPQLCLDHGLRGPEVSRQFGEAIGRQPL